MPDRRPPGRADRSTALSPASHRRLGAAIGTFAVASLFCPPLPGLAQSPAGDPETGRAIAMAVCSNCHLVSAGQRKPALDVVPSFG
jgi:mono/diheme cytochrome c family protein